jgi:WD40 repeat protein
LACGTEHGFRVYDLCGGAMREVARFESGRGGGIGMVELLYDRGLAAVVGGGSRPAYPPHKVLMWDFHHRRCTGELCFRSPVLSVKLRPDKLVVVVERKAFVYELESLGALFCAETLPNPKGLCALSPAASSHFVLACPGLCKGEVRVEQLRPRSLEKKKMMMNRDTTMIAAHDSQLACIALSVDGRLLATASSKGTLIRIFSTFDGTHLQEVP